MGYKRINHTFRVGEILENNNGYEYEVIKKIDRNTIRFRRVKDGQIVDGYIPQMYLKDDMYEVLEWQSGKYYAREYEKV